MRIFSFQESPNRTELKTKIVTLEKELSCCQRKMQEILETEEEITIHRDPLNKELDLLQQRYKSLFQEFSKLKEKIQTNLSSLATLQSSYKQREEEIWRLQDVILTCVFQGPITIFKLQQLLQEKGYSFTEEEVYRALVSLNSRISIYSYIGKEGVKYRINKRVSSNHPEVQLEVDFSKPFDFLCYSDLHLNLKNVDQCFSGIDSVNEYCEMNHIRHAFHLGDFVSLYQYRSDISHFRDVEQLKEILFTSFPRSSSVVHGFLGGNHDADIQKVGIDMVAYLEQLFFNFVSLGYYHCFIGFLNSEEKIAFHHPNTRIPLDSTKKNPWQYLNQYYQSTNQNRKYTVYDFLGHTHQFFSDSKFSLVPSIVKDRFSNGALHVQLYFTSHGRISQVVLFPLELKEKLIPVGEVHYVKSRKR